MNTFPVNGCKWTLFLWMKIQVTRTTFDISGSTSPGNPSTVGGGSNMQGSASLDVETKIGDKAMCGSGQISGEGWTPEHFSLIE